MICFAEGHTQMATAPSITETELRAIKQSIEQLGNAWAAAEAKKDVKTVSELLADEFHFTNTGGRLVSKAEWLEKIPSMNVTRFDRSDVHVQILGDTAVLTGVVDLQNELPDRTISGTYRYADVFVQQSGRWKVLYSHFTPIKQGSK
jgi:ketosteroid isomerase-like protein